MATCSNCGGSGCYCRDMSVLGEDFEPCLRCNGTGVEPAPAAPQAPDALAILAALADATGVTVPTAGSGEGATDGE